MIPSSQEPLKDSEHPGGEIFGKARLPVLLPKLPLEALAGKEKDSQPEVFWSKIGQEKLTRLPSSSIGFPWPFDSSAETDLFHPSNRNSLTTAWLPDDLIDSYYCFDSCN